MNLAARVYLDLVVAGKHPEQEQAYKAARNLDLLWLLIPVAGFLFFLETIKARHAKMRLADANASQEMEIGPGI